MRLWAEHTEIKERLLYNGIDWRHWERAARAGRVRAYDPTAYSIVDQLKDDAAVTVGANQGKTPLDIWNILCDPMPAPFPREHREVKKRL